MNQGSPIRLWAWAPLTDQKTPRHFETIRAPLPALTIFLVLWFDSIRKEEAAGATIDALGWKIRLAIRAGRVRCLLVYISLGLALYHFAAGAYGRCPLPDWLVSWLEWPFSPPASPAPRRPSPTRRSGEMTLRLHAKDEGDE